MMLQGDGLVKLFALVADVNKENENENTMYPHMLLSSLLLFNGCGESSSTPSSDAIAPQNSDLAAPSQKQDEFILTTLPKEQSILLKWEMLSATAYYELTITDEEGHIESFRVEQSPFMHENIVQGMRYHYELIAYSQEDVLLAKASGDSRSVAYTMSQHDDIY